MSAERDVTLTTVEWSVVVGDEYRAFFGYESTAHLAAREFNGKVETRTITTTCTPWRTT